MPISNRVRGVALSALFCLGLGVDTRAGEAVSAAQAGAWESFATEEHSQQWGVYDYFDGVDYFPNWSEEGEFASFLSGGNAPLWFFTTQEDYGGQNPFLGDLSAAGVIAIRMDVYVDDPDHLDFIDIVIQVNGPGGPRDYYKEVALGEDFEEAGWYTVRSALDGIWWAADSGNEWSAFQASSATWDSISEIGVILYPDSDADGPFFAAIDDIILEPRVEAPPLEISIGSGLFTLTYPSSPATLYDIETYDETERSWLIVNGYQDLSGTEAGSFQTPVGPWGIFRVAAREQLIPTLIPE